MPRYGALPASCWDDDENDCVKASYSLNFDPVVFDLHIKPLHGRDSPAPGSKFTGSDADATKLIQQAIDDPDRVYETDEPTGEWAPCALEKTFSSPVGITSTNRPTNTVVVYFDLNGGIRTAYPK